MSRFRTLTLILSAIILFAATPITAQLAGTWAGEGTGNAYPPSGETIHPWQNWKGDIPATEDSFKGDWWDADGHIGTFQGKQVPSPIPEERVFQGTWVWIEPSGISAKSGDFEMHFFFIEGTCKGTWTSIWPSSISGGTMKGERVDD